MTVPGALRSYVNGNQAYITRSLGNKKAHLCFIRQTRQAGASKSDFPNTHRLQNHRTRSQATAATMDGAEPTVDQCLYVGEVSLVFLGWCVH